MGNSSRKDWTDRIGGINDEPASRQAGKDAAGLGWSVFPGSSVLGLGGRVGCGGGRRALLVGVGWMFWLVAGSQF